MVRPETSILKGERGFRPAQEIPDGTAGLQDLATAWLSPRHGSGELAGGQAAVALQ